MARYPRIAMSVLASCCITACGCGCRSSVDSKALPGVKAEDERLALQAPAEDEDSECHPLQASTDNMIPASPRIAAALSKGAPEPKDDGLGDTAYRTVLGGDWSDDATWNQKGIPRDGDTVVIAHDVIISQNTTVGHSPGTGDSVAAVHIKGSATLTIRKGKRLRCRGDLRLAPGFLVLESGAVLMMDASLNTNAIYDIEIRPDEGDYNALLTAKGTDHGPNQTHILSHPEGHARITTGNRANGGRIIADHTRFEGLGTADTPAWVYDSDTANAKIAVKNSLFEGCGQVASAGISADGHVVFQRCLWRDTVSDVAFVSGVEHNARESVVARIVGCSFDKKVLLKQFFYYSVEDTVFKSGFLSRGECWVPPDDNATYHWKSFRGNVVVWQEPDHQWFIPYGNKVEDSLFIKDVDHFNPHFVVIAWAKGETVLRGNIFWLTAKNQNSPEGDVDVFTPMAGPPAEENRVIIERNIFLPNGNGPDGPSNLSASGFTCHMNWKTTNGNRRIEFRRNTMFVGTYGTSVGETEKTYPGTVAYFKSNLFYGSVENGRPVGGKITGYEGAEVDALPPGNADYNGSYRLENGSCYDKKLTRAKGYNIPISSGGSTPKIGPHDVDDVDPRFVDKNRTPATWNPGCVSKDKLSLKATLAHLSPEGSYSIEQLMAYLREGFRPQAQEYRGAGDPAEGSPDIGAVDMK